MKDKIAYRVVVRGGATAVTIAALAAVVGAGSTWSS